MKPHRLLLATILAMTLLASANAEGDTTTEPVEGPFSVTANTTLSCSAKLPSITLGCFWERPVLVTGPLELAVGIDAQAVLTGGGDSHLAVYGVAAWYADAWSAWLEIMLPDLFGIPLLGASDWLRIGFTLRL